MPAESVRLERKSTGDTLFLYWAQSRNKIPRPELSKRAILLNKILF
ncbi:hypothetical protein GCM10028778_22550 [Barrientosiimonas marina]